MSLPTRAEYGERKAGTARPSPRRCARRGSGGAGSRTGDTRLLVNWAPAPAPAQASQSPFRAPHRLHCRRRPPAAFTLEARWGRGEAPPHVRYRDATSACVRTNASKGGRRGAHFSGAARPGKRPPLGPLGPHGSG